MRLIEAGKDIGELAIQLPQAAQIFIQSGLEFCCNGRRSLESVCREHRVSVEMVATKIELMIQQQAMIRPSNTTLAALVNFVMKRFHEPMLQRLSTLETLLSKHRSVHGPGVYNTTENLQTTLAKLAERIRLHLVQKEFALFPAILSQNDSSASDAFDIIQREHGKVRDLFTLIHHLTTGYGTPSRHCIAEKALLAGLKDLNDELDAQYFIEHNLLYPRALWGN